MRTATVLDEKGECKKQAEGGRAACEFPETPSPELIAKSRLNKRALRGHSNETIPYLQFPCRSESRPFFFFKHHLDSNPMKSVQHQYTSKGNIQLLFFLIQLTPPSSTSFLILFYSSDGTLNLGHHLDRENRPHIQGRWWAGMCVCVCVWVGGVVTGFPDSALRGNQVKLSPSFQAQALLTVFT